MFDEISEFMVEHVYIITFIIIFIVISASIVLYIFRCSVVGHGYDYIYRKDICLLYKKNPELKTICEK